MQIGFFDSGIGGLTVLYQALKILPREDYVYYADTLHVPYGEKPMSEVKKYIFEAVDFIARQNVKALVVACNTATGAAVEDLRQKYPFPIIGIEPAVKPAVQRCGGQGKRVLVLATRLTLKEERYKNLVTRVDDEHIVDGLPLPGLVEFAEQFQFDENIVIPYLREQFRPFDLAQYGTLVLGCTHFPLFKDMMRKLLPSSVEIIDGSIGTANHLKHILLERSQIQEGTGQIAYYASGVKVEDPQRLRQYQSLLDRMEQINQE